MFGVYWGMSIMASELVTDAEQAGLRSLSNYAWMMGDGYPS